MIKQFFIKLLGGHTNSELQFEINKTNELKERIEKLDKINKHLVDINTQLNMIFLGFTDGLDNFNETNRSLDGIYAKKMREIARALRMYSAYRAPFVPINDKDVYLSFERLFGMLYVVFTNGEFSDEYYLEMKTIIDKVNSYYRSIGLESCFRQMCTLEELNKVESIQEYKILDISNPSLRPQSSPALPACQASR